MDYVAVISGIIIAVCGFVLGHLTGLRRYDEIALRYNTLYREYSRITKRDDRGRFAKKGNQ